METGCLRLSSVEEAGAEEEPWARDSQPWPPWTSAGGLSDYRILVPPQRF